MQIDRKPLVLVLGATGKTGIHLTQTLLQRQYPVRIFVRDRKKVQELFREQQVSFESIIEGSYDSQESLQTAFKSSQHYGDVKYVFSALGATKMTNVTNIQYDTQVKLIDLSKKYAIQKYFFLTAYGTDNGWSPIVFLLNTLIPNVMYEKSRAENYLRKSGLNYAIIRPPHLTGDYKSKDRKNYSIRQGPTDSSKIPRYTLGVLITDCFQAKNIPNKLTFQCSQTGQQGLQSFQNLKPDTDKSMINTSHRLAKYTYLSILVISIGFVVLKFIGQGNQTKTDL